MKIKRKTLDSFYHKNIKRPLDLTFSSIALLVLSPLLIIIIIIIKSDTKGAAIYKQHRVGENTDVFFVYKLRTMVADADQVGPASTDLYDSRITRVGKILRKYSLDELPQLLNVIKGQMSLVGYRPGLIEHYTDEELKSDLFKFKPGITGYAQINGRSNLTRSEKREWEKKYCEEVSFKTDIKIIFSTLKKILIKEGTN